MKFPRFYNPFRRIRELEGHVGRLERRNRVIRDDNRVLREQRIALINEVQEGARDIEKLSRDWLSLHRQVLQELDGHEQANEAFMVEREELKANIALRDAIGIQLVASLMAAEEVITANDATVQLGEQANEELATEVLTLRQEAQQQAGETSAVVGYVKSCEDALKVVGIAIVDGETGPEVTVDQSAFLSALRLGFIRPAAVETVAA